MKHIKADIQADLIGGREWRWGKEFKKINKKRKKSTQKQPGADERRVSP